MANFGEVAAVPVRVQRLLPIGLLVQLEDGSSGLIREREIAWDQVERKRWQQRFRVGDQLNAVPIGDGLDHRQEFSLRRAERDPWEELGSQLPVGRVIPGVIVGIQRYGAFIELRMGVIGLLHVSRLPSWTQSLDLNELFWPGDRVNVVIERIDLRNRHIRLSIGQALLHRWGRNQPHGPAPRPAEPHAEPANVELAEPPEPMVAPLRSLVVEDDPVQLDVLARWMRKASVPTWSVDSAEEALALLERQPFDIVLSDFGLPGASGCDLLRHVRARYPQTRCVLMTDWAQVNSNLPIIETARADGVQLLIKPLRPEDLVEVINEIPEHAAPAPARPAPPLAMQAEQDLLQLQPFQLQQRNTLLERLRTRLKADKVVLFACDATQYRVHIVAEAGATRLNRTALIDLMHSPVRDVAEDGAIVQIDDAQLAERRVRYLKPLLDFRSCLGVDLPAKLPDRHALFVFGAGARAFDHIALDFATATAWALATLLEREQFQEQTIGVQQLALLGQLSRALVHELNHQLSPVNFIIDDMRHQLQRVEAALDQGASSLDAEVRDVAELVDDMGKGVRRLTEIARLFGRMTVQSTDQLILPRTLIDDVVYLMRDSADRANILLDVDVAPELEPVWLPVNQLQQMLLNIVLNAIQQIKLLRPELGGRVQISAHAGSEEGRPQLTITVEDDGPGIHRQHWQRIFDLGFTTRQEGGSGIGLYVTRSLTEALAGRVFISESAILWGTVFVIELPLRQ